MLTSLTNQNLAVIQKLSQCMCSFKAQTCNSQDFVSSTSVYVHDTYLCPTLQCFPHWTPKICLLLSPLLAVRNLQYQSFPAPQVAPPKKHCARVNWPTTTPQIPLLPVPVPVPPATRQLALNIVYKGSHTNQLVDWITSHAADWHILFHDCSTLALISKFPPRQLISYLGRTRSMNEWTCSWNSSAILIMWFGCHDTEIYSFQNDMSLGHLFDSDIVSHYVVNNIRIHQLLMDAVSQSCLIM